MPAASAASRSPSIAPAVMAMIGIRGAPFSAARIRRVVS